MPPPPYGFTTTASEIASDFKDRIYNRTFLITGCTPGGLGHATALVLAPYSPKLLILASRSLTTLRASESEILTQHPNTNIRLLEIDLSSLESVRAAATQVNAYPEPIDVLLNNAGLSGIPFTLTASGIEKQFATNHIGPFLLTNLIMPRILAAGPGARIVNVSSRGHRFSGVRFEDVSFSEEGSYEPIAAYGQSKTANILFTVALAERLGKESGVVSVSVHPGSIMTNLMRDMATEGLVARGWTDRERRPVDTVMRWKTVERGAGTQVWGMLDRGLGGTCEAPTKGEAEGRKRDVC